MATIPQLPSSLFFSTLHFRKPLFYSHPQQSQIFVSYFNSTKKKNGFICFACSVKQTRVRKRVKSNEELRSEIMEFVALNGFPQGHVPSMKELSAHGRVDLANVVRRRGYKFIRELLANSDMEEGCKELISEENTKMEASLSGICLEDSLTEGQSEEALDVVVDGKLYTERFASTEIGLTAIDGSMHTDQKMISFPDEDDIANLSPEAEECGSVSRDESSLAGVSSMGNTLLNLGDSKHSGEIIENSLKTESVEFNNRADIVNSTSEASISDQSLLLDDASSCSDREVDNLLMTEDTETNNVEDHYTSQDLNYTEHVDIATESFSTKNFQNQQIDDMAESYPDSADDSLVVGSDDEDSMLGLSSSMLSIKEKTTRFIQNGYLDTVEVSDDENEMPNDKCPEETKERAETSKGGEYIGDTYGGQRSVSSPLNGSALALEEAIHATEVNSSDRNTDQREDLDPHDETRKRENQVEITRLRFMLRQKELELSRLKEQIEKEKLSLSVLQRQAETEIQKAQMLISEKDVELQEAEGSLSGLQEVEIEYCGDGNVVEVTGSFNGWEHRVGLELKPSKSIGKQKCWSTLLWLYPGTYELKFIVDGQWTTDPQRESVTRGHITNNILKVDR